MFNLSNNASKNLKCKSIKCKKQSGALKIANGLTLLLLLLIFLPTASFSAPCFAKEQLENSQKALDTIAKDKSLRKPIAEYALADVEKILVEYERRGVNDPELIQKQMDAFFNAEQKAESARSSKGYGGKYHTGDKYYTVRVYSEAEKISMIYSAEYPSKNRFSSNYLKQGASEKVSELITNLERSRELEEHSESAKVLLGIANSEGGLKLSKAAELGAALHDIGKVINPWLKAIYEDKLYNDKTKSIRETILNNEYLRQRLAEQREDEIWELDPAIEKELARSILDVYKQINPSDKSVDSTNVLDRMNIGQLYAVHNQLAAKDIPKILGNVVIDGRKLSGNDKNIVEVMIRFHHLFRLDMKSNRISFDAEMWKEVQYYARQKTKYAPWAYEKTLKNYLKHILALSFSDSLEASVARSGKSFDAALRTNLEPILSGEVYLLNKQSYSAGNSKIADFRTSKDYEALRAASKEVFDALKKGVETKKELLATATVLDSESVEFIKLLGPAEFYSKHPSEDMLRVWTHANGIEYVFEQNKLLDIVKNYPEKSGKIAMDAKDINYLNKGNEIFKELSAAITESEAIIIFQKNGIKKVVDFLSALDSAVKSGRITEDNANKMIKSPELSGVIGSPEKTLGESVLDNVRREVLFEIKKKEKKYEIQTATGGDVAGDTAGDTAKAGITETKAGFGIMPLALSAPQTLMLGSAAGLGFAPSDMVKTRNAFEALTGQRLGMQKGKAIHDSVFELRLWRETRLKGKTLERASAELLMQEFNSKNDALGKDAAKTLAKMVLSGKISQEETDMISKKLGSVAADSSNKYGHLTRNAAARALEDIGVMDKQKASGPALIITDENVKVGHGGTEKIIIEQKTGLSDATAAKSYEKYSKKIDAKDAAAISESRFIDALERTKKDDSSCSSG